MEPKRRSENYITSYSVPLVVFLLIVLLAGIFVYSSCCVTRGKIQAISQVKVYFGEKGREDCNCVNPVTRIIPRTKNIEKVAFIALEELTRGPTKEEELQGYRLCLPAGGEIVRFKGSYLGIIEAYQRKDPGTVEWGKKFLSPDGKFSPWEDRVKVKSVKIKDGVAYADFSKELYSYGGGSCRVEAIQTSIVNTLKQFPEVQKVVILVEGKKAELEP